MALLLFVGEWLVATLLAGSFLVAWYARRRVWWKLVLSFLGGIVLVIPWLVLFAIIVLFYLPRPQDFAIVWLVGIIGIAAIVGLKVVWFWGLRRKKTTGGSVAADWPLGRIALLTVIVTVLAKTTLWMFDAFYQQRLFEMQQEGQFLAASLAPPAVPNDQNAAPLYFQVFEAMGAGQKIPLRTELSDRPKGDAAPEEHDISPFHTLYWRDVEMSMVDVDPEIGPYDFRSSRLGSFLDRQRRVREILIQATQKPGCHFERDYVRPTWFMLLPEYSYLRAAARFLLIDARHAAAMGDFVRTREDIEACYRMSIHIKGEPIIIGQLVGIAIEGVTDSIVRIIFAEALSPTPELLALSLPPQMPALLNMDRAMRYEEAFTTYSIACISSDIKRAQEFFSMMSNGHDHSGLMWIVYAPFARAFFADAVASDLRRGFQENGQKMPLERISEEEWNSFGDSAEHAQTSIGRMLLPRIGILRQAAIREEIKQGHVRVALGLYRYYHGNGEDGQPRKKFPATLAELVPTYLEYVPNDPFNNNLPMSYRVTDRGCVVYSIGPDGKDEGGLAAKEGEGRDDHDFAFECLTPAEPTFPKAEPAK